MKTKSPEQLEKEEQDNEKIEVIKALVASHYKQGKAICALKSRKGVGLRVRQTAIYCISNIMNVESTVIGQHFDVGANAVDYTIGRVTELMRYDKAYTQEVKELSAVIESLINGRPNEAEKNKDYYFINLDDIVSIKVSDNRAMVLCGFSQDEINWLKYNFLKTNDSVTERHHKNTGIYLLSDSNNGKEDKGKK